MLLESDDADGSSSADLRVSIRRRDQRCFLSLAKLSVRSPGEPKWGTQTDFQVLDSGEVLAAQARIEDGFVQDGQFHVQDVMVLHSQDIGDRQRVNLGNVIGKLGDASILVGWLGRTPVAAYLQEADMVQWEEEDRLLARSKYGRIEMALDKKSGHLPSKIIIEKSSDDTCFIGSLRTWYRPYESSDDEDTDEVFVEGIGSEPLIPTIKSIRWDCTLADMQEVETNLMYPTRLETECTFRFEDGTQERIVTQLEVEDIDLSPTLAASDFKTSLSFPSGMRVIIDGASQLPYKWDGSKIVAGSPTAVPDAPVVVAEGTRNLETLLFLNVILVVVASLLFLYSKFSRGSKERKT
ncbi:MAG: CFI-box putative sorting motif-containing protein [Planctomycetota bacterium]